MTPYLNAKFSLGKIRWPEEMLKQPKGDFHMKIIESGWSFLLTMNVKQCLLAQHGKSSHCCSLRSDIGSNLRILGSSCSNWNAIVRATLGFWEFWFFVTLFDFVGDASQVSSRPASSCRC